MNKRLLLFFMIGVLTASPDFLFGQNIVRKTIHINTGKQVMFDGSTFDKMAFNHSSDFSPKNQVLSVNLEDSVVLTIVNNDSRDHHVSISGFDDINADILSGSQADLSFKPQSEGCYILADTTQTGRFAAMGLSSIFYVHQNNHPTFFWNINESEKARNDELVSGGIIDWSDYDPDYFCINANSNPQINEDSTARVVGTVGDTILIVAANTGRSIHSMHFHGYHLTILHSSNNTNHRGRSKDTFGIYAGQTLVLQLVPDKPGEYPVHDHNLVAVTGGGRYPNGMFTTMLISP